MNKAYRYRLYPDDGQAALINKTFGCVRYIYNNMLAERKKLYETYRNDKEALKKQKYSLPADYKKGNEWLKEVDSLALANAQINLESAYRNFYRTPSVGFPKFKSMLAYKLEEQEKKLVVINKWFPSSKLCHKCGNEYKELTLGERSWTCKYCNTLHDRDVNAAINIREEGFRMLEALQKQFD